MEVSRLTRDAARYQKAGGYELALETLEKAYRIVYEKADHASAANIKYDMGVIHCKRGDDLLAARAYTESSVHYKKGGDLFSHLNLLITVVQLCIELRDYWHALFQLESLVDYYQSMHDTFKCSEFSYQACQCLLAHNQVKDLHNLFIEYQDQIIIETQRDRIQYLLTLYNDDDDDDRPSDWESIVFNKEDCF